MTSLDILKYAREKRELLLKYRQVPTAKIATAILYAPNNSSNEVNVFLDASGEKILQNLKKVFYEYVSDYYKESLLNLYGKDYIDQAIYKFIRKTKYIRNIPHDLLQPKRLKWSIFIALDNLQIHHKIKLKSATFHPTGFQNDKRFTKKIKDQLPEYEKYCFIELLNIEAPTFSYAAKASLKKAHIYLSLIPNNYAEFSYKDDVRFPGYTYGHNKDVGDWQYEWQLTHKALVVSPTETKVIKETGAILELTFNKKSQLAKKIFSVAEMFFSAKKTQYPPAKLLLLATVLESLLLESTFNQTSEYKKINAKAAKDKNPRLKVSKGGFFRARLQNLVSTSQRGSSKALRFLNELYNQRSEVTHLCEQHKLSESEVKLIENIIYILIKRLSETKAQTHLSALRKLKIVVGKV